MSKIAVAMISAAATSFTDAAAASTTAFASASYTDDAAYSTDFADASYTEDNPATFTYNAAYRASTAGPYGPPDGVNVTPNYYAPNVNGTAYIVVTIIGLILATIMTLIRLYTKALIKRYWGWDDYTCATSLVGLFGWSGVTIRMAQLFLGKHDWDILTTVGEREYYFKLQFVSNALHPFVLCTIKVSILLLYLRTFQVCGRKFRIILYSVLVIIVASHTASILLDWLSITPLHCQWMYYDAPDGIYDERCHVRYDQFPYFVFMGALTIALDVIIIFLPLREILRLRMVKRQKIALIMVFLAGLVVTVASALRLVFVVRRFYFDDYFDDSFTEFQDDMASTFELDLALICASVPTLQTFLTHFAPNFLALDSPREPPPNRPSYSNRFFGRPKRHAWNSEPLSGSSFTDDTEMQSQSHVSSVTASPEGLMQSPREKSIDSSFFEVSKDEKRQRKTKITTHMISSPITSGAHKRH